MIPTFDFVNIINKAIKATITVLANPITWLLAFAAVVTGLTSRYDFFSQLNLNPINSLQFDYNAADDQFIGLFAYIFDFTTIRTIFGVLFDVIPRIIQSILVFIASVFVALWGFRAFQAVRASIKDMGS